MRYILLIFFTVIFCFANAANETWNVVVHPGFQDDEAVKVVLEDLKKTGSDFDISWKK
jgi:hypothetical protein